MAEIPYHSPVNYSVVRYQALGKLEEIAYEIVQKRKLNNPEVIALLKQAKMIRLWCKALDYSTYITREQRDKIMYALIEIAEINQFPTAPVLGEVTRPSILIGGGGGGTTINNTYDAGQPFSVTGVTSASTADSFATSLAGGAVWHAKISNGTAQRSSIITAVWDGTNIDLSEQSTPDIGGSTDGLVFSVDISGGNVRLRATPGSGTWTIFGRRYLIDQP